jgi:predicted ATPase/class 3 adenylate cyclase
MPRVPSGTVTFLFTDVEGSTRLLDRLGAERYAASTAECGAALRSAFAACGGVEVDSQGDSFFFAFARAQDAVAAARDAQSVLAEGPIRVRMGIHTGEPLVTDDGYVGMDVHRAARIAAAGHGGQILLSQATRDLVVEEDLVDLGDHRLKDLTRPERIYQLGSGSFPHLKSLNRSSLPEAAHPLVGRISEQRELIDLIRECRLVTITGAGGTGKTRLALQIAGDMTDEFPDGVFFVSLGSVSDPGLVRPITLETMGVGDTGTFADKRALLVVDNVEHLLGAAPTLAEFASSPEGPTILATSRTPLHLSMEFEYPLDPLPPESAAEMFLDRARMVRRQVAPSRTVDEICRLLDGLPLALELAAARLKLLDPPSLLERLDSRLPLLTRGSSDLPERQRTLEATIAWSFDLLDAESRMVFARLSVFVGTFDIEAAETVVGADLDALTTLVEASLLKPFGDGRFLMLETIREFARDRLSVEDAAALKPQHATYFLDLSERAAPHLTGHEAAEWLARLDADDGNLRAALDWCALEQPRLSPRFAIALWRWWLVRGRYEEGQAAIEKALRVASAKIESAELHYQLGAIVISRGATERGRECFQAALDRFREAGSEHGEARSLSALGHVATDAGEWQEAIDRYERGAEVLRRIGDQFGLSNVLGDLATVYLRSGSSERALPLALESLAIQRELGHRQGEALSLSTAGYARLADGDLDQARTLLAEATTIAHDLGYLHGLVFSLNGLAAVAYRSGNLESAALAFDAAETLRIRIGIDHDPDEILVADLRAAVTSMRGASSADKEEFDLDRAVSLALGDYSAS